MSLVPDTAIAVIGVGVGMNSFRVVGHDDGRMPGRVEYPAGIPPVTAIACLQLPKRRHLPAQIEQICYHGVATKEFCHATALNPMGVEMITIPELVAQALGSFLTSDTRSRFGASHARLAEVVPFAARLTLDCIGNSDALYHNIEHSMLVTLAGHDILMGRQMLRATTAEDYANFILACLAHDIGYVRGILQGDDNEFLCRGSERSYDSSAARIVRCRARALSCGPVKVVRLRAPRRDRRGGRRPNCASDRIYALSICIDPRTTTIWSKRRACCCALPISSVNSVIPIT